MLYWRVKLLAVNTGYLLYKDFFATTHMPVPQICGKARRPREIMNTWMLWKLCWCSVQCCHREIFCALPIVIHLDLYNWLINNSLITNRRNCWSWRLVSGEWENLLLICRQQLWILSLFACADFWSWSFPMMGLPAASGRGGAMRESDTAFLVGNQWRGMKT